ncbi:hypothetical protein D3C72_2249450 [compost metagenome]
MVREPLMTVPFTVCDAVIVTTPSGRLLTAMPETAQLPPLQAVVVVRLPMATVTAPSAAEHVPVTPP